MISKDSKILIIGLGLIGGSYAEALTNKGYKVSAITRTQSSVDYALEQGIIEKGYSYVNEEAVKEADIVIFGLYPSLILNWLEENQHLFKSGAVITDVTGVKSCIVYDIQKLLRDDVEFISAHPMAGREVYGVENSDSSIFKGANYIVVPTDKNTESATELCKALGKELGFEHISVLSPEEHDDIIGFVSQLTHCIAVSLMTCNDNEELVNYTGDSFRDLTRIARINENMWSELFMMNKEALLRQMNAFIDEFTDIRDMIKTENVEELKEKMRLSTKRRALFDKK